MPSHTHRQAAKGGERGANGEWYEGGKFINTVRENGKGSAKAHRPKPLRKAEIEPYKWVMQPFPGAFTVFSQIAGVEIYNRRENTFSFNPGLCGDLADLAYVLVRQNRIVRYNAGERWLPQPRRGEPAAAAQTQASVRITPIDGQPLELSPYGRFPKENYHDSVRYVKTPYPAISAEDHTALEQAAAACDVLSDQAGNLFAFGLTDLGPALLPIDPALKADILPLHAGQTNQENSGARENDLTQYLPDGQPATNPDRPHRFFVEDREHEYCDLFEAASPREALDRFLGEYIPAAFAGEAPWWVTVSDASQPHKVGDGDLLLECQVERNSDSKLQIIQIKPIETPPKPGM